MRKDPTTWNIKAHANRILDLIALADYEVTDIYEQSFRAIRKNEYILSELNVEVNIDPEAINIDNVCEFVTTAVHVLKRYK